MSFKRLDPEDFLVSAESIVAPAWSNYSSSISNLFTSLAQTGGPSGDYYINVYDQTSTNATAEVQFSVAYEYNS